VRPDALDDALIAAAEHHDFRSNHPEVMRLEHEHLIKAGLLDPDEPTRWSHLQHQRRMQAEFTPIERQMIRTILGMTN